MTSAATQMYISAGIDVQVVLSDARKKSREGSVMVHYHAKGDMREGLKHAHFVDGEKSSEWGDIDGSSLAPVREGQ
jgi:hypothetical protein